MNTQLKGRPIFVGVVVLIIISTIILTASNISKITEALQTPPLTSEQIDALAQKITNEQQALISQRQLQLDGIYTPQLDSLRSKISQLESENRKQDSVISYLRTYELPRTTVSVAPRKKEDDNKATTMRAFERHPTWKDTLDTLKKNITRKN